MLALADGPRPKVCLLPAASGDPAEQIAAFRTSLGGPACELSHISLFRLETEPVDVAHHLLSRDLIYVGGGSLVNLLAILRAHGLDRVLADAWERGVVLAGQSAGAMCWFEWGVTRSAGAARLAPGLGLVPGILSVHYHRDSDRRRALIDAVARRATVGHGIDDGAGLVIRGTEVVGLGQRPRARRRLAGRAGRARACGRGAARPGVAAGAAAGDRRTARRGGRVARAARDPRRAPLSLSRAGGSRR